MTDIEKSQQLGKGGNGRIFRYPLLNESYAVKHVSLSELHATLELYMS